MRDHPRGSTSGKEILCLSVMGSSFSVSSLRCLNASEPCALPLIQIQKKVMFVNITSRKKIPSANLNSIEIYLAFPFQIIFWKFFSRLSHTEVLVTENVDSITPSSAPVLSEPDTNLSQSQQASSSQL